MKCYAEGVEKINAPFFQISKKRPYLKTLVGFNLVQTDQAIQIYAVYTPLFRFGKDEIISFLEIGFGLFQMTIIFYPLFPFVEVIFPQTSKLPSLAEMNRLQREYAKPWRKKG